MVKGRKLEPRWLGPYTIVRKISDLIYRVQVGHKEVNLHVEQIKLCRASRDELRERRRQNRRRMREQRPLIARSETADSSDTASETDREESDYWYSPHDSQCVNETNCEISSNAIANEEIERASEDPPALRDTEASVSSETRHGYSLRPRSQRSYKE